MTAPLRLGVVPYLNAAPLVAGLDAAPGVSVERDVPSALVARLRAGRLDAALASAVELFRDPPLAWLPGPAVTSEGPVRSILVWLRGPPESVRTLALDTSSRSAAVLAQVCLAERYGVRAPELRAADPGAPLDAIDADAVLRIGDPALTTAAGEGAGRRALDLGALWTEATGLPFVWALWLVRPGLPAEPLTARVTAARAAGLPRRDELARAFAAAHGLPEAPARAYLREAIGFDAGERELAGLRRFGRAAHGLGLVDRAEPPPPLVPAPHKT